MMFDDEEKDKDKEDAELGEDTLDDVLGPDGDLDDEEDDPLMADDTEEGDGRDWA